MTNSTAETYRAAIWTSANGQDQLVLTGPHHAVLDDETLLQNGKVYAIMEDICIGDGTIAIGQWAEQS